MSEYNQALEDAALIIRREWVCGCVQDSDDPMDWHEPCRYSEFAARNALSLRRPT